MAYQTLTLQDWLDKGALRESEKEWMAASQCYHAAFTLSRNNSHLLKSKELLKKHDNSHSIIS
jgi:hypothetical protein